MEAYFDWIYTFVYMSKLILGFGDIKEFEDYFRKEFGALS
jgi:hypothetical protein